ncbi:MAG: MtrB/PioB family decaheme-associated outer membrane protein [Xanthomonadales bacterium]|nr:MtrB/PioB family decaheme-associated outer membrane protein [Xanthomonadales bacterium]
MNVEKEVSGTMKRLSRKFGFSISALLPVLLLTAHNPVIAAEEAEPSIYGCKQCVKYTGWRGTIDFGAAYINNDSYRFGDYRGLEEEGLYAAVDGDAHYRDLQGYYFDMYARNLGYQSREIDMRGGNQGFYEVRFGWQEIPRWLGYGTQTPFLGVGSDVLTLPDDWVKANTTSGMTALQSNLVGEPLKTKRKILDAGGTLNFMSNWSVRVDYQRQKKEGLRTMGAGSFFSNASILPTPIDFTTDLFDTAISWMNKRAQVELGFISSKFDNGYSSLSWQNPFSSSLENSAFRAALEPGNKFHQFNLSGAFAITPRIRLSGQAAMGRMKQNDPFLPYTINPKYSDLPLPRESLDGKVDTNTYNAAGKLYARISNKFSFTARGKWDKRDNKTPVDLYTPVVTDLVLVGPRYNRPYSYKRQKYSADVRYRFDRMLGMSGGYRQHNMDRTLQEVERTKETTWWGQFKISPTFNTEIRIKGELADRDISDYQELDDGSPINNPLMRKFNMADRDRNRLLLEFDFMPIDSFSINLGYIHAESQYKKSLLGLQKSVDESYSVNLNYAISPTINAYAFYNLDYIDADITNSSGGNSVPWVARTQDRIETAGIGLSAAISEKSSLGVDYVYAGSTGKISVMTSADEDPFDPLKTSLKNFKLHFDYDFSDHWGYKLYAEREQYDSRDWAIDGLGVDGINSVLSMGEQSPEYSVWYYRFQISYRF